MKRTLLVVGFTVFGALLWFGLRSDPSVPQASAKHEAFPLVQQKLTAAQGGAAEMKQTEISGKDGATDLLTAAIQTTPISSATSVPGEASETQPPGVAQQAPTHGQKLRPEFDENEFLPGEAPMATSVQSSRRPTPSIRWPLALQELSPEANLRPELKDGLTEIADRFIEAVGGEDQTPDDPAYRARWRALQPAADQAFRTLYGSQAWLQLQNSTTHDASQPPPASNEPETSPP